MAIIASKHNSVSFWQKPCCIKCLVLSSETVIAIILETSSQMTGMIVLGKSQRLKIQDRKHFFKIKHITVACYRNHLNNLFICSYTCGYIVFLYMWRFLIAIHFFQFTINQIYDSINNDITVNLPFHQIQLISSQTKCTWNSIHNLKCVALNAFWRKESI